jgi:hypothetical protein
VLTEGIRVEVALIEDPRFVQLIGPVFNAVHRLELVAPNNSELLGHARALVRGLLGMSVPWRLQVEAIASTGRVGRYATRSLEARLDTLREVATVTGDAASALEQLIQIAQGAFKILRRVHCMTPKQVALLEAASQAQRSGRELCIVCENDATKRAVQAYLGEHEIEVIDSHVEVVTRGELHRAAWAGEHSARAELLLIEPLGFSAGFFFSGLARAVRVLAYDLEREAVERQLGFIAHDTQCASVSQGDKLDWVVGIDRVPTDARVEVDAPLWRIQYCTLRAIGVFPGDLPEVRAFRLSDSGWLQRALEATDEPEADDDVSGSPDMPARSGRRIRLELDDDEEPAVLSVDTPLLLLDELQKTGEGTILAADTRPGMVVLIPRRTIGAALLDRLLEEFESSSEYVIAAQFLRMWKDAVARLVQRTGGSATIAYGWLARHGVRVTTAQAVYYWMRGMVLGPRNAESIRALGEAIERSDLTRHYLKVHAAIGEVRRWRRALARKLAEYVRVGRALGPDAVIDSRLGLRRGDLEAMTRIGRVTRVTYLEMRGD